MKNKIGHKLKAARAALGLSLEQVANRTELSVTIIHAIESGRTKRPKMSHLVSLAKIYNLPEDDIIIAAEKIPSDVYWKIVGNPALLNTIREINVSEI